MLRQRPALRIAGAVACLGLLASCSGTVGVDAPAVHGSDARACAALVKALPAHVADQKQRKVDAGGGYADAWGDPAIVLRCGVPRPKGFTKFAACQQANGVGWFVPQSQQTGKPETITMTTIGRAQNVEVTIPPDYWPPPATMADLAPAIKRTIREVRPCV